jgi:hypothetical protein
MRLANRAAYVPPQCFTQTRGANGEPAANPCFVCHTRPESPNFTDDADLQLRLSLPPLLAKNPWTNLFDPPVLHTPRASDAEVTAYVRRSNYFDANGSVALAATLASPPPAWDANHNGKWDGFTPDVSFAFDDRGFDHRPDGSLSGWRAFAYFPFPGTFFPTNGAADDVAIRLDPAFREAKDGRPDAHVYEVNLAIVEALIARADVAIDPVDEKALGVDLDRDGRLATASRVAFDAASDASGKTRMRYVGRAHDEERAFPIAPGFFPTGTEFFHTVRYLDTAPDGTVTMAPRMKEVRYAKKTRWSSYAVAQANAIRDAREQDEAADGTHEVRFQGELGIYNSSGWLLQGFIEAADGNLRPQSFEESASCEGCHGGLGVTTDSTFSFARKMTTGPARGWFHWSQRDLRGIPEPKRADGEYEYTFYLREARAGDELRGNTEVLARFFDAQHALRPSEVERLHGDISTLLLPSAARALDLDRATMAIVATQSFDKGRDPILAPATHAYERVSIGDSTGITTAVVAAPLLRANRGAADPQLVSTIRK